MIYFIRIMEVDFMKGQRVKQINNLIIRYTEIYQYSVWTYEVKCLEDRLTLNQAETFCRETKDFIKSY